VAAGAGVTSGIIVLRRFLEQAPFLKHMLLKPPEGEELDSWQHREMLADLGELKFQIGVTTTPLMPSGKARFGDRLVDVVSDGDPIDRGVEVEVIEAQAHRVLVRKRGNGQGGTTKGPR
jgi:membrane-bound ClpP family serine protease